MKKIYLFIVFLLINFGGLAIGNLIMGEGPTGEWYNTLRRAPWTPPGWVFGASWTLIMLCFSWYLAELFIIRASKFLWSIYTLQVVLNVSWNWLFFNKHLTGIALLGLILLTLVITYFFITFRSDRLKNAKYLLLPYISWLCVAISLNTYVVVNN
ncbi:TspO/MBR family protein [Winogradskyella alexanderae]|uniref:Tryptophan-rich sensory protein n=1 Tax=Winogradskyella alexanderae TaxID=2877123 RepID=A0ABS7XSH9_9FLAO|nr:TspO/MBR family protein [Winogradskyella alexanderae]MCA0131887.1 tryptophan-rich sensory protein [Winogradskyella alexanderae]